MRIVLLGVTLLLIAALSGALYGIKESGLPIADQAERYFAQGVEQLEGVKDRIGEHAGELAGNLARYDISKIEGLYRLSRPALVQTLFAHGDAPWLWQASLAELQQRLRRHPWVADAKLTTRLLPLRVEVSIREEEPWLVAEYESRSWLVARSGKLLAPLSTFKNPELIMEASELPRLQGLESNSALSSSLSASSTRLDYAVRQLLLIELAGGFPFEVSQIILRDEGSLEIHPLSRDLSGSSSKSTQVVPAERIVISALSFDLARQRLGQLQQVLADLTKRGETVKELDLRFHGQAVVRT